MFLLIWNGSDISWYPMFWVPRLQIAVALTDIVLMPTQLEWDSKRSFVTSLLRGTSLHHSHFSYRNRTHKNSGIWQNIQISWLTTFFSQFKESGKKLDYEPKLFNNFPFVLFSFIAKKISNYTATKIQAGQNLFT